MEFNEELFENIVKSKEHKQASSMYKRIIEAINEFEESIKDDEQASVIVSAFANTPILINEVGFWDPDIIVFYGSMEGVGSNVQVFQHITQLNLCLIASKRPHPEKPRRKIGFSVAPQED